MSDDSERAAALHELLQTQGAPHLERPSVLVHWVIVEEWIDDDGWRTLSRKWSDGLSTWGRVGMLHEALYGDWENDGDDDT